MLAACVAAYCHPGAPWYLFAGLFLAPDRFMVGYLRGSAQGARLCNLAHTDIVRPALAASGHFHRKPALTARGLIWAAHLRFDRLLGYGLKYPTAFQDTHLSRG